MTIPHCPNCGRSMNLNRAKLRIIDPDATTAKVGDLYTCHHCNLSVLHDYKTEKMQYAENIGTKK